MARLKEIGVERFGKMACLTNLGNTAGYGPLILSYYTRYLFNLSFA